MLKASCVYNQSEQVPDSPAGQSRGGPEGFQRLSLDGPEVFQR